MKKSLLAFAVLAAATSSFAGDVSVFGVVDVSTRHVRAGASAYGMTSGGDSASRIGIRGSEDLGAGLKASFHLEQGFEADSGISSDASREFGRRSTLSLSGRFGELRLGRDETPTYSAVNAYDPFGGVGVGSLENLIDAPVGTGVKVRSDNMFAYFSPKLGGFSGQVNYAKAEAGIDAPANRYMGGRADYVAGPLSVTGAYAETRLPGGGDYELASFGASYDLKMVKVGGNVVRGEATGFKSHTYALAAEAPVGRGTVKASYARADAGGTNKSNLFAVGYAYSLSKRTAVYGTAALVDNDATAARGVLGGAPVGVDNRGYEVGVRHSF